MANHTQMGKPKIFLVMLRIKSFLISSLDLPIKLTKRVKNFFSKMGLHSQAYQNGKARPTKMVTQ